MFHNIYLRELGIAVYQLESQKFNILLEFPNVFAQEIQ